jgi:hypothetical protein
MSNLKKFYLSPLFLTVILSCLPSNSFGQGRNSNFSIDPLGLLAGVANLEMEWSVADDKSIGPTLSYSNISSSTTSGSAVGFGVVLTVNVGHKVFTDGWFLRPSADYAIATANSQSATGLGLGADVGYWWFQDNGINFALGLGYQYFTMNMASIGLNTSAGRGNAMAQIGYSF